MDYNLERQRISTPEYNIDIGMRYGDMPSSMLMRKFEETNLGPDEHLYDGYARQQLTNWGPDTNLMEHERPRGGVNRRYGVLELRTNGHRGNADYEKPEMFLGFGGPEDRDPRGINTEPDMKLLTKQQQARMRFQRFTPDHSDHVTGGGRSEAQAIADNQKVFKIRRDRLKVFDRQLDGRREGLRRVYDKKSDVTKQVLVQSYGDYIRDYALNPQRRVNIIAKNIIRDSKEWRNNTVDQDYQVALYTQICRRRVTKTKDNRIRETQNDMKWQDNDTSHAYKAAGLLMSHLCRSRAHKQDTEFDKSQKTQTRKHGAYKDLMIIMNVVSNDGRFEQSDDTQARKLAAPQQREHLSRSVVYNHSTPAHHLLNAEIIYKNLREGRDMVKIKSQVITDAKDPHIQDSLTRNGKTGLRVVGKTGRRLDTADDGTVEDNESQTTVNYKTLLAESKHRKLNTSTHKFAKESDDTQTRKTNHKENEIVNKNNLRTGIAFSDNLSKDRKIAPVGSKYLQRHVDRDNNLDEINL